MLAEPGYHTRCFVEWEQYPQDVLRAGMRAGYFADAPIWDDITTFRGQPYRGAIDTIIAGYPCQPFSSAGQRRGEDDERHLWPDVARIIREIEPTWVFLENVSGHVSLGAETVLRELWGMGYTPAAGLFSAAEVGAPHERKRWFCVAHADGGDAGAEREQRGGEQRFQSGRDGADRDVGDAESTDWRCEQQASRARGGRTRSAGDGAELSHRDAMADTSEPRSQGGGPYDVLGSRRGHERGSATRGRRAPIFPPGPKETDTWRAVLSLAPDLSPAVSFGDVKRAADSAAAMVAQGFMAEAEAQSLVCRMVNGLAERTRALRLLGNGVHPLAAGYAWRTLSAAHGLLPVDLAAAGRDHDHPALAVSGG